MVLDLTKENVYILWGANRDEKLYFVDLDKLTTTELTLLAAHVDAVKRTYKEEKALIHFQLKAEDFTHYSKQQLLAKLYGVKHRREVYIRFSTQIQAIKYLREEEIKAADRRDRKREYRDRRREREQLTSEHQITYNTIADRTEVIRNSILRDRLRQLLGDDAYKRVADTARAQAIEETLEWMEGPGQNIPDPVRTHYYKQNGKRLKKHAQTTSPSSHQDEL
jgi:hypothetical protein